MNRFLNREEELRILDETYSRQGAQLALIYGRRRVGKTRLLQEFSRDKKPTIFYTATRKSEAQQAHEFSDELEHIVSHATPLYFDNWPAALSLMLETYVGFADKVLVVLDEFSEIDNQNASITSELSSKLERFPESNVMIVLSGSAIKQMERLKDPSEPLHRRFTCQFQLKPFRFREAQPFFGEWSFARKVEAYSILGGMPMYLEEAARYPNILDFLRRQVVNPRGLFLDEGEKIINQEFGRPARYFAILTAIAGGKTKGSEISNEIGLHLNDISDYLRKLEEIDLVVYEVPATETNRLKSKKGLYFIKDNFLRFWFRYVYRYRGRIELGEADRVMEYVERDLSTLAGFPAEEVVRDAVRLENSRGNLPISLDRVDRYWDKNVYDIDVCGVGERGGEYLWGNCKWQARKMGVPDYISLKQRVIDSRVNPGGTNVYLLCSRSGFTRELTEIAEAEGAILWDARKLESIMAL
jgi:AAA+ ATPase superfamily predicted ATPase